MEDIVLGAWGTSYFGNLRTYIIGADRRDGDAVRFAVIDSGPGISAELLPRVFDRFWQARSADRRGAGLGLAIAHGLVAAHGGRIGAESVVGEGSTFWFTLPLVCPESARER